MKSLYALLILVLSASSLLADDFEITQISSDSGLQIASSYRLDNGNVSWVEYDYDGDYTSRVFTSDGKTTKELTSTPISINPKDVVFRANKTLLYDRRKIALIDESGVHMDSSTNNNIKSFVQGLSDNGEVLLWEIIHDGYPDEEISFYSYDGVTKRKLLSYKGDFGFVKSVKGDPDGFSFAMERYTDRSTGVDIYESFGPSEDVYENYVFKYRTADIYYYKYDGGLFSTGKVYWYPGEDEPEYINRRTLDKSRHILHFHAGELKTINSTKVGLYDGFTSFNFESVRYDKSLRSHNDKENDAIKKYQLFSGNEESLLVSHNRYNTDLRFYHKANRTGQEHTHFIDGNGQTTWFIYGEPFVYYFNGITTELLKGKDDGQVFSHASVDRNVFWTEITKDWKSNAIYLHDGTQTKKIFESGTYFPYGDFVDYKNGKLAWSCYDENSSTPASNIFLYDGNRVVKVTQNEDTYVRYMYPRLDKNGNVACIKRTYTPGTTQYTEALIYATPAFTITNVGDGESIRLKFPKYSKDDKEVYYRISRKAEGAPEEDWDKVNEDGETVHDRDEAIVIYLDTKKDGDPDEQNPKLGYKGPIRGQVYEYKVEVVDSVTQDTLDTFGGIDLDGDGVIDDWKKGVTEPFLLLVRGYGDDETNYFEKMREEYLANVGNFVGKGFRLTKQPYQMGSETFHKPKTIWDPSILEHDNIPYPKGEGYRMGQLDAYNAGESLLRELGGIAYNKETGEFTKTDNACWLDELKTDCNRKTQSGVSLLDYTPEHIYIYCHSMGGTFSRYLEYLINKYRANDQNTYYIPFVKRNIMFTPGNLGSSLSRTLLSKSGPSRWLSEWWSEKKKFWLCTFFAQPEVVAIFNRVIKPSNVTTYHILSGDNWWGGGFPIKIGPIKNTLTAALNYCVTYCMLLAKEADKWAYSSAMFSGDMFNDAVLTVRLERGKLTKKVWKYLKKHRGYQLEGTDEETMNLYGFNPNPKIPNHINIREETFPLNHSYGALRHESILDEAWRRVDLYPRLVSPPITPTLSPPPEVSIFSDTLLLSKNEHLVTQSVEKEIEFSVPIQEKRNIIVSWLSNDSEYKVVLEDPNGTVYDGEVGSLPSQIKYLFDSRSILYSLEIPIIGTWKIKVTPITTTLPNEDISIIHFSELSFWFEKYFEDGEIFHGAPLQINTCLWEGNLTIKNANITATIVKEDDGTQTELTLFDDGNHGDLEPNDGIYGNTFLNTQELGYYSIEYNVQANTYSGQPIQIKEHSYFSVVETQNITIGEVIAERLIGSNAPYEGIEIDVTVTFENPNPYIITGELYDSYGQHIAHGEGIVTGEPGDTVTATLRFKGDDLFSNQDNISYSLKDLMVCKPNTLHFTVNPSLEYTTNTYNSSEFQFIDQDNDNIRDLNELNIFKTDPTLPDTDNDGLSDFEEINYDGNPTDLVPGADTNPLDPDTDGDEHVDGRDAFPLDPDEWSDRDGDGYGDNSDYDPDDPNVWENPNEPPVAVITGTLTYELTSIDGALISIDASQSSDPDEGDIIESYTWTGSFGSIQGAALNINLPLGNHDITLVVNDGELDSEPATATVTVQDTTAPSIVINSPESKAYGISEDNPIISYEVTDLGGVSEEIATINGVQISKGEAIKLIDLLVNSENILQVKAIDPSGNESVQELSFSVFNSTSEIGNIIDNALNENKIHRVLAILLKVNLRLYDYFINTANFYESIGKSFLANIFKRIANRTLFRMKRSLNHMQRWVDPEVRNILLISIDDLQSA